VVVFDISEKIDDFLEHNLSFFYIAKEYYFVFIPYFVNLFSSMFTFIAVIFFTSKLTANSEVIAILSSGISFKRFLLPYFWGALIIAIFNFILINWIIPPANAKRLAFEEQYIYGKARYNDKDFHLQIEPETFIYMQNYNNTFNIGYKFSMESFEGNQLKKKLLSNYIQWDTTKNKWKISDYYIREFTDSGEVITSGKKIDTTINLHPDDFNRKLNIVEAMNWRELNNFIEEEKIAGSTRVLYWVIEKNKRIAMPFSTFILTLIGVSLSSRKRRGGIGINIGVGLLLSFSYILFMQVTTVLATNANFNPLLSVWIPNITFAFIGLLLYFKAAK
jgi:lipopolysaccharide export system permease protein